MAERVLGFGLDGRVGLHMYFLIKCIDMLAPGGRLAFLLPADVCEGVSSFAAWNRLCALCRLEAVLTFSPDAAPFPNVDTNAMVFLLSRAPAAATFKWMRVMSRDARAVTKALLAPTAYGERSTAATCHLRNISEALATGLSRPVRSEESRGLPLSRFARVVRGIASGANEFFFLTEAQVRSFALPIACFRRAVGRTRDCPEPVLNAAALDRLEREGRPTWLLNLDGSPREHLPGPVQKYLNLGEQGGLPSRALIKSRKPWFRMEQRAPPPILFAYLGRRDCRFILNETDAVPLTGFLCVYPLLGGAASGARNLWMALNHPLTIRNLAFAGKSYGGGAVKVEPRQLDNLEIPYSVLEEFGLSPRPAAQQMALLESRPSFGCRKDAARPRAFSRAKGPS